MNTVFKSADENPENPGVIDVDCEEIAAMQTNESSIHLVDVRRDDELVGELGKIAGVQHIVLDSLMSRLQELPEDKSIVFVCRSGGRSARAASIAAEGGFTNIYNLRGGMLRWNALQLPVQRK